jgi:hypothetical protein
MKVNETAWQNGDEISFKHPGAGQKIISGKVRGYATTELPVCGRGLIVELDEKLEMYGTFNHIVVMESWLIP